VRAAGEVLAVAEDVLELTERDGHAGGRLEARA
jgi:hypothetical protein